MRSLVSALFVTFLAVGANAQSVDQFQDPPDLVVVKQDWSKERINWERDPFGGPVENYDEMRARARNERRVEEAKRVGSAADVDRVKREARADAAIVAKARQQQAPPRYVFMYKVTLRNTGARAIKAVDWDYVFFDADTQSEVGRHQFTSEEKISPGKSKELDVLIGKPPTATVSVYTLHDKERRGLAERVVIMGVQYADGTVWKRP